MHKNLPRELFEYNKTSKLDKKCGNQEDLAACSPSGHQRLRKSPVAALCEFDSEKVTKSH
jgi:hypothetical protein